MSSDNRATQDTTTKVRADSISLEEFSSALTAGILRAMDSREPGKDHVRRPWVWAGWIIGDEFGPIGPLGPFGPNGPGPGPLSGAGQPG